MSKVKSGIGCGCLFLVISVASVFFIGIMSIVLLGGGSDRASRGNPDPSPELTPEQEAESAADAARKSEQDRLVDAAKQRQADAQQKAEEEEQKRSFRDFNDLFRFSGIRHVQGVSHYGNRLTVTVENAWHYQPYQIRLQYAQKLWFLWKVALPPDTDDSLVAIEDQSGNRVGGLRIFSGDVWVKE